MGRILAQILLRFVESKENDYLTSLHNLSACIAGKVTESIAAVDDRVERGNLSISKDKVGVCSGRREEKNIRRAMRTFGKRKKKSFCDSYRIYK